MLEDDHDDGFGELDADEGQARRLLTLAIVFMNSQAPLSMTTIGSEVYPGLGEDALRKAFKRDREALAGFGVVIRKAAASDGRQLWTTDDTLSFDDTPGIPLEDALAIDLICQPLLADPSFPQRDELRFALAKIDTAFGGPSLPCRGPALRDERVVSTVRSALSSAHAVRMSYTNSQGMTSERVMTPWGLFGLRGQLYLVGPLVREGAVVEDSVRVYNCSRIGRAQEVPGSTYPPPADFAVEDYRRLPFQLGDLTTSCRLFVPQDRAGDFARTSMGRGETSVVEGGMVWSVMAGDLTAVAHWAVAEGLVPLFPEELVVAWRSLLEEAIACGR